MQNKVLLIELLLRWCFCNSCGFCGYISPIPHCIAFVIFLLDEIYRYLKTNQWSRSNKWGILSQPVLYAPKVKNMLESKGTNCLIQSGGRCSLLVLVVQEHPTGPYMGAIGEGFFAFNSVPLSMKILMKPLVPTSYLNGTHV